MESPGKVESKLDPGVGGPTITTAAEHQYNGLTWRTVKRVDTGGAAGLDEMRVMIYAANWQMLEERVDSGWTSGFTPDSIYQTIYGLRYIDDVICRLVDGNANGTVDLEELTDKVRYHLTDNQFSTVAVLDENANLLERVTYDPYGKAPGSDLNPTLRGPGDPGFEYYTDLLLFWKLMITPVGSPDVSWWLIAAGELSYHDLLDLIGFIPILGEVADGINAGAPYRGQPRPSGIVGPRRHSAGRRLCRQKRQDRCEGPQGQAVIPEEDRRRVAPYHATVPWRGESRRASKGPCGVSSTDHERVPKIMEIWSRPEAKCTGTSRNT